MPTPSERNALIALSLLTALGAGTGIVRGWRSAAPDEQAREALRRQIALVDSVRAEGGKRKQRGARGGARGDSARARAAALDSELAAAQMPDSRPRVDLDLANESDILGLPGLSPSLARRLVANRDSLGPFGSLGALKRVRGVTPAVLRTLAPQVTFSLPPRPSAEAGLPTFGPPRPPPRPPPGRLLTPGTP